MIVVVVWFLHIKRMLICCRKIVKLLQHEINFSDGHMHHCNGRVSGEIFPFNVPHFKKINYEGD